MEAIPPFSFTKIFKFRFVGELERKRIVTFFEKKVTKKAFVALRPIAVELEQSPQTPRKSRVGILRLPTQIFFVRKRTKTALCYVVRSRFDGNMAIV